MFTVVKTLQNILQKNNIFTKLIPKFSQRTVPLSLPSFNNYELIPELLQSLEKQDITTPTSIQDMVIPELNRLSSKNYYIAAQTGTGKTLSYLLPIMNKLKSYEKQSGTINTKPNRPQVIIIVPTKELVTQVVKVAKGLGHFAKLKIMGLNNFDTMKEQKIQLDKGVDILVATIDRLEKHKIKQNVFISNLQFLIVDEADTFMDGGYKKFLEEQVLDLQKLNKIRESRSLVPVHSMFVAATYTNALSIFFDNCFGRNSEQIFKKLIEKKTHINLSNLYHEFIHVTQIDKHEPLVKLLKEQLKEVKKSDSSVMVFCNSITSCQALEYVLMENNINCCSLHGNIPKKAREQNFNRYIRREINVLISTDLGSRGLDFSFLTHIINFDFPRTTTDYLHRAGRAGRAGKKGYIFSLYHQRDMPIIKELQQAHESGQQVRIRGSSYSLINKEILRRQKQLNMNKKKDEYSQEFLEQKEIQKQLNKSVKLPSNLPVKHSKSSELRKQEPKNYKPMIDKDIQQIKTYQKKTRKLKKYERAGQQNMMRKIKLKLRGIRRRVQKKVIKK